MEIRSLRLDSIDTKAISYGKWHHSVDSEILLYYGENFAEIHNKADITESVLCKVKMLSQMLYAKRVLGRCLSIGSQDLQIGIASAILEGSNAIYHGSYNTVSIEAISEKLELSYRSDIDLNKQILCFLMPNKVGVEDFKLDEEGKGSNKKLPVVSNSEVNDRINKYSNIAKYLIFISHAGMDRGIANLIASRIKEKCPKNKVEQFIYENDIKPGDHIQNTIKKMLQKCDELLVLLTPNSINRHWVLAEIGAAWGLEKRITPVTYGISPEEMPDILHSYKAIDLNNFDEYIKQLNNRLKELKKDKSGGK